jgi:hypothetical protein
MLGLQCYAKIKVKCAVVVTMVTQDEFWNLNISMSHHGAIDELVEYACQPSSSARRLGARRIGFLQRYFYDCYPDSSLRTP